MALTQEELDLFASSPTKEKPIPSIDRSMVKANSQLTQEELDLFDTQPLAKDVARENLNIHWGKDADKATEYQTKAKSLGLPASTSLSEEVLDKELLRKQKQEFDQKLLNGGLGEATSRHYQKPENAAKGWDDSDILGSIENHLSSFGKEIYDKPLDTISNFVKSFGVGGGLSLAKGITGTVVAASDVETSIVEEIARSLGFDDFSVSDLQKRQMEWMGAGDLYSKINPQGDSLKSAFATDFYNKADVSQKELQSKSDSFILESINEGAQSSGASTATSVAGFALRKNLIAHLGNFGLSFGPSYMEAKKENLPLSQRLVHGGLQGSIEAASEAFNLKNFEKIFKGEVGKWKEHIAKTAVVEVASENIATVVGDLEQWWMIDENKGKTFLDYVSEIPEHAAKTTIAALTGFGIQTGITKGAGYVDKKITERQAVKSDARVKAAQETVTKMLNSESDQSKIDNIIKFSQESLTLSRDKESFEAFIQDINEKGIESVYVPYDIASQLSDLPEYVEAQMNGRGYEIEIPIHKFMTDIATNETLLTAMRPHISVNSGYTLNEIQSNGDDAIKTLVEQVKSAQRETEELDQGYETIKQQLIDIGLPLAQAEENALLIKQKAFVMSKTKKYNMTVPQAYEYFRLQMVGPDQSVEDAVTEIDQDPLVSAKSQGYEGEDIGESKEWVAATKKFGKEGMTKEARMERAKEAGFRTEQNFSHSTYADFKEFSDKEADKSSPTPDWGRFGFHFGSKEAAAQRAEDIPKIAEMTGDNRKRGKSRTIDVFLKYNNPLDLSENRLGSWSPRDIYREIMAKAEAEGIEGISEEDINAHYDDAFERNGEVWTDLDNVKEQREFIANLLEELGYDAITYENEFEGGGKSVLVWKPENIRSINAAFDPDYKDSANILHQPDISKIPEITRKIIGKNDLLLAYTLLTQDDEVFTLPVTNHTSVPEILRAHLPNIGKITLDSDAAARSKDATTAWSALITVGKEKRTVEVKVYQNKDAVWIDVAKLESGNDGKRIYNAIANYAFNTGKVFQGDPDGLSDEAKSRRLENMISSALKFGTTDHLWPHEKQMEEGAGVPPIKWKDGDDAHNLEQMIRASYEFVKKQFPEISNLMYDYKTDQFIDVKTGTVWDEKRFDKLAASYDKPSSKVSGQLPERKRDRDGNRVTAGRTTLERAVFTHTFLRPESSKEERRRILAKLGEFGSKRITFFQSQPTNITTPEQLADKLNPSKERETSQLQKKLNQVEALSNCLKKG